MAQGSRIKDQGSWKAKRKREHEASRIIKERTAIMHWTHGRVAFYLLTVSRPGATFQGLAQWRAAQSVERDAPCQTKEHQNNLLTI